MQLGIGTKFIGILLVAAVIPLCIGVTAVWVLGSRYYRREKGILFESLAIHLAQGLNQAIDGQVEALDDHRAGVFIADVMGHGARSALVTAILRTLLQDLSAQTDSPAKFLELMNRHFYDLVEQSKQIIFVSAFYLIVDTEKVMVTYASAGHPSPLVAERRKGTVHPLIQDLRENPALGLLRDSQYTSFTSFTAKGDVFLLYADGVTEATDVNDEEFGHARLSNTLKENLNRDVTGLTQSVIEAVNRFAGAWPLADDICLVAVEAAASSRRTASQPVQASSAS